MAARHQAYLEYQKTMVDWMGEVPAGWDIKPCRAVVQNMEEKNEGALDQNYLSLMANVGVILYEDKGDVGNKKPDDLSKCKIVKKGNLVINSMNYSIGSYGMSEYDGVCSPVYIVLDPDENVVHRRFALRIFENSPFQKYLATFGNGILAHRAAIGWDDIKGAYIPVPSKNEQLSILNFLDHETAKIDTLIDKQQQLIKLLKEKRQAVISHAVTKGLNPAAPMKDSGVEWLGEVPEHWKVLQIRRVLSAIEQGKSPECENRLADLDEWAVLKTGCVNGGVFREDEHKALPEGVSPHIAYEVKENDLLMSRASGSIDLIGRVAYVEKTRSKLLLSDKVFRLFTNKNICKKYLWILMNSPAVRVQIELAINGAEGLANNITKQSILSFQVALPPITEQEKIVASVLSQLNVFDCLTNKSEEMIAGIKERRTALISAAVTGKIDVRNWQPAG